MFFIQLYVLIRALIRDDNTLMSDVLYPVWCYDEVTVPTNLKCALWNNKQ